MKKSRQTQSQKRLFENRQIINRQIKNISKITNFDKINRNNLLGIISELESEKVKIIKAAYILVKYNLNIEKLVPNLKELFKKINTSSFSAFKNRRKR